jgi:cAMP phosphodiesterase
MKTVPLILYLLFIGNAYPVWSQRVNKPVFEVVPLGVKGGIDEGNLSSYLLGLEGTNDFICLDAGTLYHGIRKAVDSGIFREDASRVLKKYIKAYLISHAHLDHVAGLVINSPEDTAKNIYGLPFCLDILKEKYFTWKNWANFANEGEKPTLNKYRYEALTPLGETAIENTTLFARAFILSHGNPYQSTAFLIRQDSSYFLYLGDTGADETEKTDMLHTLWMYIGPLVKEGKLRAIFIEVSYPDEQPLGQLFGHLTPKLFMKEMQSLATIAGEKPLRTLKIAITHIKPIGNNEVLIKKELAKGNFLHLDIIYPEQAKVLHF